jgi:HPt (histidine-containing phosphotransfer) domain-containing protein
MSDNDHDMKKTMLLMLLDDLPYSIDQMKEHLSRSNWQDLRAVAHKMKSTLSFVGNDQMSLTNRQIEQIAIWQNDLELLPGLISSLGAMTYNVLPELESELEKL